MRMRLTFPLLTSAALALLAVSTDGARAGSFFGPSCYGSDYTTQYPNRSHNSFGCGPGMQCQARHPLFKHRLFRKNQDAQASGAPPNMMQPGMMQPGMMQPGMMQPGMMPAGAMPIESMQMPIVQAPIMQAPIVQEAPVITAPIHTASAPMAPVPVMTAAQSRIVPVPAPLPSGPASPEPPVANQGKPPF